MEFFNEAVKALEMIVEALKGVSGNAYPLPAPGRRVKTWKLPEFDKTMVRVKKHVRPPVRADPEGPWTLFLPETDRQPTIPILKTRRIYMGFFTTAVSSMSTLVVALGGGVGVWGVINLMEGYGSDNPASKSQGVKQLMAGGGIMLLGLKVVPLLSTLITI
jgi:hypothetical protein